MTICMASGVESPVTKMKTHSLAGTWLKVVFEVVLNKVEEE